jgi:Dolichyl-phosphate-mannose-protein mannosyltransferase
LIPDSKEAAPAAPKESFLRLLRSDTWISLTLLAYGAILMLTNPWFTAVDDEIAIIDAAARPVFATLKVFLRGGGQHEHPPLYDLILHGWLRPTHGNIHLLRLPAIVFYLLGAWFLMQAARRMAGERARNYTLLLVLLWPYDFHPGRLAGWYSFTFLLVSLLTLAYLKYAERSSPRSWMPVVLCALALVYTNYIGWALLGCLGLDLLLRFAWDRRTWLMLLATGAFLMVASIPIMPAFVTELHSRWERAPTDSAIATGIYNLYCLFVSESVAPWFWVPGIAAGLAIAAVFAGVARLDSLRWPVARGVARALVWSFVLAGVGGLMLYGRSALGAAIGITGRQEYLARKAPNCGEVELLNGTLGKEVSPEKVLVFFPHVYYLRVPYLRGNPDASWAIDPLRFQTDDEWRTLFRDEHIGWVVRAPEFPAPIAQPLNRLEAEGSLVPVAESDASDFANMRITGQRQLTRIVVLRVKE